MRLRTIGMAFVVAVGLLPVVAAAAAEPEEVVGSAILLDCTGSTETAAFGERDRCVRARIGRYDYLNLHRDFLYFIAPDGSELLPQKIEHEYSGMFLLWVDALLYLRGEDRAYGTYTFHACEGIYYNPCKGDELASEFTIAPVCLNKPATQWGTDGDDRLYGTAGADVLVGLGGTDLLEGRGGDDLLCGGSGHDYLHGEDGDDILIGEGGGDWLWGGPGADLLIGKGGADSLNGGAGDDDLRGGFGIDTASYTKAPGPVRIDLGAKQGTGAAGTDVYYGIENGHGSRYNDVILGNRADNLLSGNLGNDRIKGKGGDDFLMGDDGNDLLVGGPGSDEGDGGHGKDTCRTEVTQDCEF